MNSQPNHEFSMEDELMGAANGKVINFALHGWLCLAIRLVKLTTS